ncbi:MAG: hypothetical protein AAF587_14030 [Bacteroidota bacterium]
MSQNTVFTVLILGLAIGLGAWIYALKIENNQLKAELAAHQQKASEATELARKHQEFSEKAYQQSQSRIDSLEYALIDCKDQQLRIDFSN